MNVAIRLACFALVTDQQSREVQTHELIRRRLHLDECGAQLLGSVLLGAAAGEVSLFLRIVTA